MTYTYTAADMVKAELRATIDFSASTIPTANQLATWIAEESDHINSISGRNWGQTSYSETIDYRGEETITLKHAPLISVTSLLYSTGPLGTTTYGLTAIKTEDTHYTVYDEEGEIVLLPTWSPLPGRKRFQINYSAGYVDIPERIQKLATKVVAKRVLDTLIKKDINEKQSGKSVSVGSISIVKPANFGVAQYETLQKDLERLENEVINGTTAYRIGGHRY